MTPIPNNVQISSTTTYFPDGVEVADLEKDAQQALSAASKTEEEAQCPYAKLLAAEGFRRVPQLLSSDEDFSGGEEFEMKKSQSEDLKELITSGEMREKRSAVVNLIKDEYIAPALNYGSFEDHFFQSLDKNKFLGENRSFRQVEDRSKAFNQRMESLIKMIDGINFSERTEANRKQFLPVMQGIIHVNRAYMHCCSQVASDLGAYLYRFRNNIFKTSEVSALVKSAKIDALQEEWKEGQPFQKVFLAILAEICSPEMESQFMNSTLGSFRTYRDSIVETLKEKIAKDAIVMTRNESAAINNLPDAEARLRHAEVYTKTNLLTSDQDFWVDTLLRPFLFFANKSEDQKVGKKRAASAMLNSSKLSNCSPELEFYEIVRQHHIAPRQVSYESARRV